ncbi:hypothetical protein HYX16_03660 [Candidatus Woesearchaeota archaeon]|nr:hypothetical protein [Candidatus Woesearchaeota archaeon]
MKDNIDFEKSVLKAMVARDLWGSNWMKIDTIVRSGFPSHLRGEVKKTIHNLLRKGYIIWYDRSRKGIQLDKNYLEGIFKIIENKEAMY